jgi:hypothetical protein
MLNKQSAYELKIAEETVKKTERFLDQQYRFKDSNDDFLINIMIMQRVGEQLNDRT